MAEARDWTQGYRRAWLHLRGGLAWTLLGWSMQMFHPRDPMRVEVARALLVLCGKDRTP